MANVKFKLKLYPISEDGEQVYEGGWLDVISVNFVEGSVECYTEYTNSLVAVMDLTIFRRHQVDTWYYKDNRDKRDKQSELWFSVNGGEYIKYEDEN